jgi:hypothetical protein
MIDMRYPTNAYPRRITMLYPKREQKLSPEDFKNPGSEYRAAPAMFNPGQAA